MADKRHAVTALGAGILLVLTIGMIVSCAPVKTGEPALRVGAVLPQTGAGAVFAEYIKEGLDLAAEEINAEGTVQTEIFYEDSKSHPRDGVQAFRKLLAVDQPPVVIVALSSVAGAVASLAGESGPVQVYIAVAIPDITDGRRKFRVYPRAEGMAGVMAQYSAALNHRRAAVIYINDDFGRVSLQAYREVFSSLGGEVAFSESYELQQTDFKNQASKVVAAKPDVVYLSGYGPAYGTVVQNLREAGFQGQLTADMTLGLPSTRRQVGEAAEDALFVDGKISEEFERRFRARYGKEPTSYAGYAYDAMRLLARQPQPGSSWTSGSIADALRATRGFNGVMGSITIGENGDSDLEFVVKRVDHGRVILAEPIQGRR